MKMKPRHISALTLHRTRSQQHFSQQNCSNQIFVGKKLQNWSHCFQNHVQISAADARRDGKILKNWYIFRHPKIPKNKNICEIITESQEYVDNFAVCKSLSSDP